MDTRAVSQAAKEIEKLTLALNWLDEYGRHIPANEPYAFNLQTTFASQCDGYFEAITQIESQAKLMVRDIIDNAIRDCTNTIEILKDNIRREVSE